nr:hypothetical protein [Bacillus thuringiensis]
MQKALEASMSLLKKINLYSVDEFIKSFKELASQYEEWINSQKDLEQKMNLNYI